MTIAVDNFLGDVVVLGVKLVEDGSDVSRIDAWRSGEDSRASVGRTLTLRSIKTEALDTETEEMVGVSRQS